MINKLKYIALCIGLIFGGCEKEELVIYDVDGVSVTQPGAKKPNVKSTTEFISITYTDLFGSTIDQSTLTDLALVYAAFGDNKLIEDMIIRNFLVDPNVSIPSQANMNDDVNQFVIDTYSKFYNREPNEFEAWQIANLINNDNTITPEMVYYAFLTSNEYRYY